LPPFFVLAFLVHMLLTTPFLSTPPRFLIDIHRILTRGIPLPAFFFEQGLRILTIDAMEICPPLEKTERGDGTLHCSFVSAAYLT
jgi:hypothetical protein